jgi:hypothetical protein
MYLTKIREISLTNKYTNWYISICQKAQARATTRQAAKKLLGSDIEGHHILPKSFKLGGEKDTSNYAYLSTQEHFICHLLLTKMFKDKMRCKMTYAMTCFHRKSPTRILTSKQYATAVRFYKEKFDEDRCKSIRDSRQLTPKVKCPHCDKEIDPGNYKQFHGDNCKLNPAITSEILAARSVVKRSATLKSISTGTHKHRSPVSYGTLVCPHCNKTGTNLPAMKRHHFDNCKLA